MDKQKYYDISLIQPFDIHLLFTLYRKNTILSTLGNKDKLGMILALKN